LVAAQRGRVRRGGERAGVRVDEVGRSRHGQQGGGLHARGEVQDGVGRDGGDVPDVQGGVGRRRQGLPRRLQRRRAGAVVVGERHRVRRRRRQVAVQGE